jgi:hypothetical protein
MSLEVNTPIYVTKGGNVLIRRDTIFRKAATTYNILSGPTKGVIDFIDASGTPISSFTQNDLNNGRVRYSHTSTTSISTDSFTFNIDGAGSFTTEILIQNESFYLNWVKQNSTFNISGQELFTSSATHYNGNTYVTYVAPTGVAISGATSAGNSDIVIFKITADGITEWTRQLSSFNTSGADTFPVGNDSTSNPIVVDNEENVYICYNTAGAISGGTIWGGGDIVILKMNKNGSLIWVKQPSEINKSSQQQRGSLAVDYSNNLFMGFNTTGAVAAGYTHFGNSDLGIAKIDTSSGNVLWVVQDRAWNTIAFDEPTKIAVDSSNNVVITFVTTGTITGGTKPVISGTVSTTEDVVVAKINGSTGATMWARQLPLVSTVVPDYNPDVICSHSGNDIYIAYHTGFSTVGQIVGGTSAGGVTDLVVFKLDTCANLIWAQQRTIFNSSSSERNSSIILDKKDNVLVSYHTGGTITGGTSRGSNDIVLLKLDSSGTFMSTYQYTTYNTTASDINPNIELDASGNAYITYYTAGTTTGGTLLGANDVVVFKLNKSNLVLTDPSYATQIDLSTNVTTDIGSIFQNSQLESGSYTVFINSIAGGYTDASAINAIWPSLPVINYTSYFTPGIYTLGFTVRQNGIDVSGKFVNINVTTPNFSITQQPTNKTTKVGESVSLTLIDNGSGTSYQWRKNGVNISGANSSTFTTTATSLTPGRYDCVITNSSGSVKSNIVYIDLLRNTDLYNLKNGTAYITKNNLYGKEIVSYNVTTSPLYGRLEKSTNAGVAITSFTQNEINSGIIRYVHTNSIVNDDSFIFTTTDSNSNQITNITKNIVFRNAEYAIDWTRQIVEINTTLNDGYPSISVDLNGNSYISYQTEGQVTDGTLLGGTDIVVAKFDNTGTLLWTKQNSDFNTSGNDFVFNATTGVNKPQTTAVDRFGYFYFTYVAAGLINSPVFDSSANSLKGSSDIVVVKMDSSGSVIWVKQTPSFNSSVADNSPTITVDFDGNVFVGYVIQTAGIAIPDGTATGSTDIALFKLDPEGNILWTKQSNEINTISPDTGISVMADYSGNLLIAYFTNVAITGGTVISGGTTETVTRKINGSDGSVLWSVQHPAINSNGNDYATKIAVDNFNNAYVTYYLQSGTVDPAGTFMGTNAGGNQHDIVVYKISDSGVHQWSKQLVSFNSSGVDVYSNITLDNLNNVFVSYTINNNGASNTQIPGGTDSGANSDIGVFKLDTDGTLLWAKQDPSLNTTGNDRYSTIDVDGFGNIYIAYESLGQIEGGTKLGLSTIRDIIIYKLKPSEIVLTDGSETVLYRDTSLNIGEKMLSNSKFDEGLYTITITDVSGGSTDTLSYSATYPAYPNIIYTAPSSAREAIITYTASQFNITSGSQTFDISVTKLGTPLDLSYSQVSDTSHNFYFDAVTDADSYIVDQAFDSGFTIMINSYDVSQINLVFGGLSSNTEHFYRVKAVKGASSSDWSSTLSVLTQPEAPEDISVNNISTTSYKLTWDSTNGADYYQIQVSPNSNFSFIYKDLSSVDLSINVIDVSSNTTYYNRVRGFNTSGFGPYSVDISLTTVVDTGIPDLSSNVPANTDPSGYFDNIFPQVTSVNKDAFTLYLQQNAANFTTPIVTNYNVSDISGLISTNSGISLSTQVYFLIFIPGDTIDISLTFINDIKDNSKILYLPGFNGDIVTLDISGDLFTLEINTSGIIYNSTLYEINDFFELGSYLKFTVKLLGSGGLEGGPLGGGGIGDPFIKPLYGNSYYLPNDEDTYLLFSNNSNIKIYTKTWFAPINKIKMSYMKYLIIEYNNERFALDIDSMQYVKLDNIYKYKLHMLETINKPNIKDLDIIELDKTTIIDHRGKKYRPSNKNKNMNIIMNGENYRLVLNIISDIEYKDLRNNVNIRFEGNIKEEMIKEFNGALIMESKCKKVNENYIINNNNKTAFE